MDINLYGKGELPELTDDQIIKEFYNRLWDNPAFAHRVSRILIPWDITQRPPIRHRLALVPIERGGSLRDRVEWDNIYKHQGYELLNPVTRRVGN